MNSESDEIIEQLKIKFKKKKANLFGSDLPNYFLLPLLFDNILMTEPVDISIYDERARCLQITVVSPVVDSYRAISDTFINSVYKYYKRGNVPTKLVLSDRYKLPQSDRWNIRYHRLTAYDVTEWLKEKASQLFADNEQVEYPWRWYVLWNIELERSRTFNAFLQKYINRYFEMESFRTHRQVTDRISGDRWWMDFREYQKLLKCANK